MNVPRPRRTKAEIVRDWRQRQKATDPTYLARERERVRAYRAAVRVLMARYA